MKNLQLTKVNQNKWYHNTLVFLAPVGVIYLVAVVGVFSANEGAFSVEAFIPNQFVVGAMTLYILNAALDYLRKIK